MVLGSLFVPVREDKPMNMTSSTIVNRSTLLAKVASCWALVSLCMVTSQDAVSERSCRQASIS
jgi:hypothetical protein